MGLLILMAMIVIPIVEIGVFIQAGELIGLWSTIGLVILTAMAGSALLRHQGLSTLSRVRENMSAGRLPVSELFDGLCLLVAGAFLLTPGFVTDGFGLLLFLPIFRGGLRRFIAARLKAREKFNINMRSEFEERTRHNHDPHIIDGDFHEIRTDNDSNKIK